ncbi:alpha/beta hydrolase family protein [Salinisphaera sp.]|uniref:alpha/beta hydrolase family protein n=1 Tax=Salinisphaera sp. TaxID=1914330 RepID=UPI002D7991A1|nr:prolyl oligopeptidase family serine peptidase [Salinisphaera sp.]HET7314532.1 prolyl oligopeptidase family serine peptidase [Salinisphaera sp.]
MQPLPDPSPMRWQPRRFKSAAIVVAVGLGWLAAAWQANWAVAVVGSVPGVVLIATGAGQLFWAGDRQLCYHMALAGPVSSLLALILGYWLGWIACITLIVGGAAAFIVAGWALRIQHPVPADVSPPTAQLKVLAKIAADAALLGFFVNCARVPHGAAVETDIAELEAIGATADERDWLACPERLHGPVGPFEAPRIERARTLGIDYEWLTAASRYTPDPALPGIERWQAHARNRTMAARVLRHGNGAGRPWLLCIHGYRMGVAGLDFQLFDVGRLHARRGLNLMMPILPLHGVRRATPLTGGLFLDGPFADLMHAQAQSLVDLRGCIAWIRAIDPDARIGVLGYSLGGYHAALLAAHEPDLACVIAGIPMTDIPATLWQHLPTAHARYLEARGLSAAAVGTRLAPVSPLVAKPRVARERRFIFAATADQLIAPEQPLALWRHWDEPALQWYHGSHLSVRHEVDVDPFINRALADTGMHG